MRPEQSNSFGPAAPNTYGSPMSPLTSFRNRSARFIPLPPPPGATFAIAPPSDWNRHDARVFNANRFAQEIHCDDRADDPGQECPHAEPKGRMPQDSKKPDSRINSPPDPLNRRGNVPDRGSGTRDNP